MPLRNLTAKRKSACHSKLPNRALVSSGKSTLLQGRMQDFGHYKAINTNKCVHATPLRSGFQTIVLFYIDYYCTCIGGLETEAVITNKCVPLRYVLVSRLLWFCGFKGLHVFHRRFALYVTCAGLVSLLR